MIPPLLPLTRPQEVDAYRVSSASLELCLTSSSIVSAVGVVSQWRDISGRGNHATFAGSPALDTSQTFGNGVLFDGVNDVADGSLSPSFTDSPGCLFVLHDPTLGVAMGETGQVGYAGIYEETDNGASGRGLWLAQAFGSMHARVGSDTTAVSYVITPALMLTRVDFDTAGRTVLQDGKELACSGLAAAARSVNSYRMGQRFDNDVGYLKGKVFAILRYSGAMTDRHKRRVEKKLLIVAGLSFPYAWPLPVVQGASDPRLLLPPVIPAIVGRPVELWLDGLTFWAGRNPYLTFTCDIQKDACDADRLSFTPTAPGDYALTLTAGDFSKATVLRAIALPAIAVPFVVATIGHSIMGRAREGWMQILETQLTGDINFVGTVGPSLNYTVKGDGVDSTTCASWNSAASVLFFGGVMDVPHWLTLLSATPNVVAIDLQQNDVGGVAVVDLEAAITAAFVHLDTIIAALRAALPGVRILLLSGYPLNSDPASGWGTLAARNDARGNMHRWIERLFDGDLAENANVEIVHVYPRVDPIRGYQPDPIHPNCWPGHEQMAVAVLATLVAPL